MVVREFYVINYSHTKITPQLPLLAMLWGTMQPVLLAEMHRTDQWCQQVTLLMALLQTLSMLSKWQQSMSMELAHSVNPSHWEVHYNSRLTDLLTYFPLCCQIYIALFTCTGAPQLVTVTPVNFTTVYVSWSEVQCFNESGAVTHCLVLVLMWWCCAECNNWWSS